MKVFIKIIIFSFTFFNLNTFASSKTILFINDINWPPFFFQKDEGNNIGLGKEIINHCLSQNNFKLQYKNFPIKRTHLNMQSGELDVSVYSYKKERESFVIYGSEPIFFSNYGFASNSLDEIEINKLDDIKPYQLGHLAGLAHTKELMKIIDDKIALKQVTIGYNIDSMLKQLIADPRRFQVIANSMETLSWRAKQLNIESSIKLHDFILKRKPYYVTVSKTSRHIQNPQQFLTQIDTCIKNLRASGKYKKFSQKYGL
jgi:polar amino acid transport system substrate-binding protein